VQYECDQVYPRGHRAERDRSGLCTAHADLTHIAVDAQFVAGGPTAVIESNVAEHAGRQSERTAGISDATECESASSEGLDREKGGVRGGNSARHGLG
jgi:hypothetical protein